MHFFLIRNDNNLLLKAAVYSSHRYSKIRLTFYNFLILCLISKRIERARTDYAFVISFTSSNNKTSDKL